jgi:V/A-type H+-transporting ATPase subunit A
VGEGRRGVVAKVSGPIVVAKGVEGVELGEVVYVGEERLLGEVVRVSAESFTVQVYEDTEGLRPGEPVEATGRLLTAELGPGLLAAVFDGIQRPLSEVAKVSGPFVRRGVRVNALPRNARWRARGRRARGA